MARPESNTVTYYPHIVGEGKKMYFIDKKYGNDGYATWFKILDKLAVTDFHYLDLNKEEELMFLASKCNVSEDVLLNIISDLVKLGKFDKDLWESKVIWDQSFIDSIQEAYKKRNNNCITIDGLRFRLLGLGVLKPPISTTTVPGNTQSKEEYSKVYKSKVDETKVSLPESPKGDQAKPPKNINISTFDLRKEKFKVNLYPYTNYGKNQGPYSKEMVLEFFDFWSEPNKSRSQMRWESEKTWDLGRRLATWARKEPFIKKEKPQPITLSSGQPINHDDR